MSYGVVTAFSIFRKIFPVEALETTSPEEIIALGKIYTKWEWIALPFVLAYVVVCGVLWFMGLDALAGIIHRSLGPSVILVVPVRIFWGLPAMFLGIVSSAVPTDLTQRAMLGDRYPEFIRWNNLRHRFDGWRAFRWLSAVAAVGSALSIAAGLTTWTAFREDGVGIHRPLPWKSSVYPYDRVRSIALIRRFQAPNGNMIDRPHLTIRFDDGETWTSQGFLSDPDAPRDAAIATFVCGRSEVPLQELDLIDDLKP